MAALTECGFPTCNVILPKIIKTKVNMLMSFLHVKHLGQFKSCVA